MPLLPGKKLLLTAPLTQFRFQSLNTLLFLVPACLCDTTGPYGEWNRVLQEDDNLHQISAESKDVKVELN